MNDLSVAGGLAVAADATVGRNLQINGNGFVFGALTVDDISIGGEKVRLPTGVTLSGRETTNRSGVLRVETRSGWTEIGPDNSGWSHFRTDRSRFYFNRPVHVASGEIGSYRGDLKLHTAGQVKLTVRQDNGRVGIGTTNPRTQLHVLNGIASGLDHRSAGSLTLYPPDGGAWFHIDNGPSRRPTGRLRISHGGTPGQHELLSVLQNGRVGIGTTNPRRRLEVVGDRIRLTDSRNTAKFLDLRVDGGLLDIQGHDGNTLYLNTNGRETRVFNLRSASSATLKRDIQAIELDEAVELLDQIEPVRFRYRTAPDEERFGLIAERTPQPLAAPDHRAVDYDALTVVVSRIVVEQQRQIAQLTDEVTTLQGLLARSAQGADVAAPSPSSKAEPGMAGS